MSKRLSYNFVKNEITKKGYKLLSANYINARSKLKIICSKGHEIEMRFEVLRRGGECNVCANKKNGLKKRLSYEDVKSKINSFDYTLLSKSYKGRDCKIKVKCDKNHVYETSWRRLQNGSRCSRCASINHRLTYDEVKRRIEQAGYRLISKTYLNNREKVLIECDRQHQYYASVNDFSNGKRCSVCNKKIVTYEEIKKLFKRNGCQLLSDTYKQAHSLLKVQCNKGHVYKVSASNFKSGKRCPVCASYGFNNQKPACLYYAKLYNQFIIAYKIGVTNNSPDSRLSHLGCKYEILYTESFLLGKYALIKEKEILEKYKAYKFEGNPLKLKSGFTEIFKKDVLKKDC